MNTPIPTFLASLAMAAVMALSGTAVATAQSCIDNSVEIQALIDQGAVVSLYDAMASAGYGDNQVLNYRLCDEGGGYVWIIGVLSADGTAQNLTISAN